MKLDKPKKPPIWKELNLYFVHLRLTNPDDDEVYPFGGITFCYQCVERGSQLEVKYAIAVASIMDTYNKKKGRMISSGRLTSSHYDVLDEILMFPNGFECSAGGKILLDKEETGKEKSETIVKHLQEIGKFLMAKIFLEEDNEEDEEDSFEEAEEDDTPVH
jgi:hypothetical protein